MIFSLGKTVPIWHCMAASCGQVINHITYLVLFYLRGRVGQSLDSHLTNQFIKSTKWQEFKFTQPGVAVVTALRSPLFRPHSSTRRELNLFNLQQVREERGGREGERESIV